MMLVQLAAKDLEHWHEGRSCDLAVLRFLGAIMMSLYTWHLVLFFGHRSQRYLSNLPKEARQTVFCVELHRDYVMVSHKEWSGETLNSSHT